MFALTCTACPWAGEERDLNACPECGSTISVTYPGETFELESTGLGIWRYASRLPLKDRSFAQTMGEGNTPLLPSARFGVDHDLTELYFKMEGANPTGSYKDRIAAVGISRLCELGKVGWAATSSGNAGSAFAAYGARAGVDGFLFTLEHASKAKLAQILAYGPRVMAVKGLGTDPDVEKLTWKNLGQLCTERNWMMLVTARSFSPHAMEGVKTISFEICEQLDGALPDVVYVPVGGGGLLSTMWKGFKEAHAAGWIDQLPRMVGVQACGCDAVTRAWRSGGPVEPISTCTSVISGIQLTAPPDGDLALDALTESGGWALSVPDDETFQAQAELAATEGIFVEPAAAITLAAVGRDLKTGRLNGHERVVCCLTGVGFKDGVALERMGEKRSVVSIRPEEILALESESL